MKSEKLQHLEALRGIAALMVVFAHLQYTFAPSFHYNSFLWLKALTGSYVLGHILHSFVAILFNGGLAVYIFWFMSAYVLSIKLFQKGNHEYLFKSLIKRYFRLVIPVLGSVLFAYFLLKLGFMYNGQLAEVLGNSWLGKHYDFQAHLGKAILSSFWDTFFSYEEKTTYNAVLWTMNPELLGSYFIFTLFALFQFRKSRYIFYTILSILFFTLKEYAFVSFILGFWLCDLDHTNLFFKDLIEKLFKNSWLTILFFLMSLIVIGKADYLAYGNLFGGITIVIFVMKTKVLQSLLNHKFLTWLGRMSFSLYLIHLPVICSFSCFLYLNLSFNYYFKVAIISISTLVLCLSLSYFFSQFIDRNAIRLANHLGNYIARKDTKANF